MSAVQVSDDRPSAADSGDDRDYVFGQRLREVTMVLRQLGDKLDGVGEQVAGISDQVAAIRVDLADRRSAENLQNSVLTALLCREPAPRNSHAVNGPLARITVLLVEDTDHLRDALERRLEDAGATVISVASAAEALRIVAEELLPDVAMVDQRLRGTSGGGVVIHALAEARPDCGLVLTAGLVGSDTREILDALGHRVRFLAKPFGADDAICAVKAAYDDARARHDTEPPDTEPAT